ncbi:hypothetical protein BURK2_01211 [Burkholderiales bacterium]|nr:hypothetical protein BURK2_01211 [Burkholderiales bacterium]
MDYTGYGMMTDRHKGNGRMSKPWDIFCKVIDNFGDAGVCWRLARQLAAEYGLGVRLWIDAPEALAPLVPDFDREARVQQRAGVEVHRWPQPWVEVQPGRVVIEAFGCALPDTLLEAMARCDPAPVWLNLEYLSAEPWVEGHHGLPSRHPRLPLTKQFFFPGFTPATGGLLRERDLLARRDAFHGDLAARLRLWKTLGLPVEPTGRKVSLFCYPESPVLELLQAWSAGTEEIFCLVPEGPVAAACASFWGRTALPGGAQEHRGALTLSVFPFLPQEVFDLLLWACDLNFVRGEDSFVRAQWAARPMIWQPYRQGDNAHLAKLAAFLARQQAYFPESAAKALADLTHAWSGEGGVREAWLRFAAQGEAYAPGAEAWASQLAGQRDLCGQLVDFADKMAIMRGSPSL